MSLDINQPRRFGIPRGTTATIGICSIVLGCIVAGFTAIRANSTASNLYTYTITQSLDTTVTYTDTSFFTTGPSSDNSIYVSNLTDSIEARLKYTYEANRSASLTYRSDVTAELKAEYPLGDATDGGASVWSRQYTLDSSGEQTQQDDMIEITPSVHIPLPEYQQQLAQLNTALELSLDGTAQIVFTTRIKGEIDGQPISDVRRAVLTIPLGEQVYSITPTLDDEVTGAATPVASDVPWYQRYLLEAIASSLIVGGGLVLVYGARRTLWTSSYHLTLSLIHI